MDLKNNKKEIIYGRLKKTAAKIWDIEESDMEGFDPVVDLLFSACASEFERLSTELNISQTRILEKVSQILLPEVFIHPTPSFAILHAKPVNPERYTDTSDQFIFEKEVIGLANKNIQKKIYFSPASSYRLVDAEVAAMATSFEIFQIKDILIKNPLVRTDTYRKPQKKSIWIGLKANPSVSSLRDLSFYFDWINIPEKEDLLNLLRFAKLGTEGKNVSIKTGFSDKVEFKYKSDTNDILNYLDINIKTEGKIINMFKTNFITITEDILPEKRLFPSVFTEFYSEDELKNCKEELLWMEVELPEVFPAEYLGQTVCTPNAFPVINRKLHSSNRPYTLNEDLNILPLITEDHFLSMRNIISSNHLNYQEVPFNKISDFAPGTYTIRTHGIKRFDERDAYDNIKYLVDLLREEHVAFRSLGSSLIEKELNDLQIIINRLNLGISKSKEINANTHFLIVKSELAEDIWLEYWSTSGTFSNNIPMGSSFTQPDFDKKTLKTLFTSAGGRNPPDRTERIFLFKNELLSRNRVVTKEDIRAICFSELGNALEEVNVEPGAIVIPDCTSGMQNCINVKLRFRNGITIHEKGGLIKSITNSLEQKSSCIYNYKVEPVE
jgi:hypothetical protein